MGCTKEVVPTGSKYMLGSGCHPEAEDAVDLEDSKTFYHLLSLSGITESSQKCSGMLYHHSHGTGAQSSALPKTLEKKGSHPGSAGLMDH